MKLLKKAKDLWKQHPLMDTPQMAKELGITQRETLNLVYKFTTPQERSEREYRIAKDYYDSTGSWPEGYAPAFEEEADEAQAAPQAEPPSKEEPDAELVEPHDIPPEPPEQKEPSRYQLIAAHLVQISLQLKAIEEEFENYKREKEESLIIAHEAIEAAKEEAAKAERQRILNLINIKEN